MRACADGVTEAVSAPASAALAGAANAVASAAAAAARTSAPASRVARDRIAGGSARVRVQPVDGRVRERAHAERQPFLVDVEQRRVVRRRGLRVLRGRRDSEEEEESWNDMLVEGEVLGAGDL